MLRLKMRYIVLLAAPLWLTGCGGGSGTIGGGGGISAPTVAITANPTTITLGASSTLTIVTSNANTCTGTSGMTGAVTTNGTVSVTPTATGSITYGITCSGAGGSTAASVTVTVNPIPVTITGVTVTANPTSITTAQTAQCSATVTGTGSYSSAVTWTATGGTITSAGVFTPSGAGTGTCTASSAQSGYTNVSSSATITISLAAPSITTVTPPTIYLDDVGIVTGVKLFGANFTATDTVTNPTGNALIATFVNSGEIDLSLNFDTQHYNPGWLSFTVCHTGSNTTCSSAVSTAFIGNQNTLAIAPSGELFQLDQAQGAPSGQNGYLRKFAVSGGVATADGNIFVSSLDYSDAIDNQTGDVVGGGRTFDENGNPISVTASDGNSAKYMGDAAKNGIACETRPSGNLLSCYTVGQVNGQLTSTALGSQPWSLTMGTLSGATYAFPVSRDGTVTLWKVAVPVVTATGSVSLAGITNETTLAASGAPNGGLYVVYFETGPAAGTLAVLSVYDKLLVFVNATTMQETKRVTLTGAPFRLAADQTNGNAIVAFANVSSATTSFAAVNPSTAAVTALTSTSTNLATGFAVSADGKYLYACMRASCDVQPNK